MDQENQNIIRIPITHSQKYRNSLGKTAVPCEVSERFLRFSDESDLLQGGEFIALDVMTVGADENQRKLCELIVTRENLLEALNQIKPKEKHK